MEPEGEETSRGVWRWLLPVIGVVLAATAAIAVLVGSWPDGGSDNGSDRGTGTGQEARPGRSTTADEPAPVAVASDARRHDSLRDLLAAADLVVEAEVVSSVEGRWFGGTAPSSGDPSSGDPSSGDPSSGETEASGGDAILSRFVTLRIVRVLAGTAPSTAAILIEEEGWTADGAPLVVDGLAGADVGDRGIWFLVEGGDADVGAYVVLNAQGRYLERGDGLVGADGADALVAELAAMTPAELADAVSQLDATG